MSELQAYHCAVPKPREFVKQISNRPLHFEILGVSELRSIGLTAQPRDPHDLHIAIENWLARANEQVLDTAELVLAH
jgi:hypothetical protein